MMYHYAVKRAEVAFEWIGQCPYPATDLIFLPENSRKDESLAFHVIQCTLGVCECIGDFRDHSCEGNGPVLIGDLEPGRALRVHCLNWMFTKAHCCQPGELDAGT